MKNFLSVVTIMSFLIAPTARIMAHNETSQSQGMPETPIYLYHWVASSKLKWVAERGLSENTSRLSFPTPSGEAPFFKMLEVIGGDTYVGQESNGRVTALVSHFPELSGEIGIYATTNPATGSMGSSDERYGDILVRFKLNQAKVRRANLSPTNEFGNDGEPLNAEQRKANLFYHQAGVKEWIIRSPDIIESFTADPEVLRPELEAVLHKLKLPKDHPDFLFSENEIHYNSDFNDFEANPNGYFLKITRSARNYAIYAISKFLKYGRLLMPEIYMGEKNQKIPMPQAREIEELKRQFVTDHDNIEEHERKLDAQITIDKNTVFDLNFVNELSKVLSILLSDRLAHDLKSVKVNNPYAMNPLKTMILEVQTAVLAPIANPVIYDNRFSGRYRALGVSPSSYKEPFERLTETEVKELNELIDAAANPRSSAKTVIEKIANTFNVSPLIVPRVEAVFNKYKVANPLKLESAVKSCQGLF